MTTPLPNQIIREITPLSKGEETMRVKVWSV